MPSTLSRLLESHRISLKFMREAAKEASDYGDDGTNDLIVSDLLRTHEMQVWFIAEHLAATTLLPEAGAGLPKPGKKARLTVHQEALPGGYVCQPDALMRSVPELKHDLILLGSPAATASLMQLKTWVEIGGSPGSWYRCPIVERDRGCGRGGHQSARVMIRTTIRPGLGKIICTGGFVTTSR